MLHADGLHGDGSASCRKDTLRLLKSDLDEFNLNNVQPSAAGGARTHASVMCSFYLKSIVLNLFEKLHGRDDWAVCNRGQRYVDALDAVVDCLERRHVEHYFIAGENLLADKEATKIAALARFFSDKRSVFVH